MTHIENSELRERLIELLRDEQADILRAWLASGVSVAQAETRERFSAQAQHFLGTLIEGLRQTVVSPEEYTPENDAALQRQFPLVYRVQALLALGTLLATRFYQRWHISIPSEDLAELMRRVLAALPAEPVDQNWFTERLGRLNHISWTLNSIHDHDAIIRHTLQEAPALVEAESSVIWLWDADQQMPVVLVSAQGHDTVFPLPDSLLRLLRQACDGHCAFSVDPGESEDSWPDEIRGRPVAFIPLQTHRECIGVLTVRHRPDARFSHDDILLLSSLGNIASTALLNVQLHISERHLVNLLQTSIRQVVQVASNRLGQHEEFIQSMLQVAEGLTRAEAVCAVIEVEDHRGIMQPLTGSLAVTYPDALRGLARQARAQGRPTPRSQTGILSQAFDVSGVDPAYRQYTYALAMVESDRQPVGMLTAISAAAFTEDQIAFLETIAEQIGVGLESMRRSTSNQRLLVEVANVNYVSQAITHTFDQRKILSIINQAASQVVTAPIAFSGWYEDDGTFRVPPGTAVGLRAEVERKLRLTDNHRVIRAVITGQKPLTSQDIPDRKSFPVLERLGVRSWACVPMMVRPPEQDTDSPQVRGIMLVGETGEHHFTEREIALLSTYANQGALAMANSILYTQVEEQLQQIRLLYENLSAVTSTLDLQAILDKLLDSATLALQLPAGMVTLTAGASEYQQVKAAKGLAEQETADLRFRAGDGIIGAVFQRGEPIESSNLGSDGRCMVLSDLARRAGLVSSMTVPLEVQGRPLGTLTVFSREMHAFTAAHRHLLATMATQGAVAIENARAFARERERAADLDTLLQRYASRLPAALEFVHQLVRVSGDTGEPHAALLGRVQCLIDMQLPPKEALSPDIEVKDALTRILHTHHAFPAGFAASRVTVSGTRITLPMREAMALMTMVYEWLRASLAGRDVPSLPAVTLGFHQIGRETVVQFDVDSMEALPLEHAVLDMAIHLLHGAFTLEQNGRQARLRFERPAGY